MIEVRHCNGLDLLKDVKDGSVDLILTDPPYVISKSTGMDKFKKQIENGDDLSKTEKEWKEWVEANPGKKTTKTMKSNFLKYGSIYGKKYATTTQFGKWDEDFTLDHLDAFIVQYYDKLRDGGTCIIWFDLWKIGELKSLMEKHKFKQIRLVEWLKTNPQPINSSVNYLTNAREVAVLGVKKQKPTFNSRHDKGVYEFPLASSSRRFHPTQKSIPLFQALIEKHSNPGDLVMDTFLGGGTTAYACKATGRRFVGSEINKEYYEGIMKNSDML
jgi:DNA modification methylase